MVDKKLSHKILRSPFALKQAPENFTLHHLFKILNELPTPELIGELSIILREDLRNNYPQGTKKTNETYLYNGLKFSVDLGDIFGAEFNAGYFNEAPLLNALAMSLPEKCSVIDVGANFGLFALHAAHVGGPESKVVAFEPHPSAHDLCVSNIEANGYENRVTLISDAVGAKVGTSAFFIAKDSAFSGFHDTKRSSLDRKISVNVTTLDDNRIVQSLGSIDFLKIDVEGHEGDVIAGALNLITNSPNLLISLEYSHKNLTRNGKKNVTTQLKFLLENGFNLHLFADKKITVIEGINEIPKNFSGTLILARPSCDWYNNFCASLKSTPDHLIEKQDVNLACYFLERLKAYRQTKGAMENIAAKWGLDSVDQTIDVQIKNKLEVFQKEKVTAKKENEALEKQLKLSKEKNEAFEKMLNASKADVTKSQAKIVELKKENETLKDMVKSKSTDVRALGEKLNQANASLDEFRNQLSKAESKLKAQISKGKSRASEQADIKASFEKMLNASKADVTKSQEKIAELKKENKTLKDMVKSKSTDVRALGEKLNQANASLEEFRNQLSKAESKLKTQISKSESRASEQADIKASFENMLNASKADVTKSQEKIVELKKENKTLKDMVESKSTDVRTVREKLAQANASLDEFRNQLSKAESKLKAQISKSESRASEQAGIKASFEKMLSTSKADVTKSQEKIVELKKENKTLKDMVKSKSAKLKTQISKSESRASELRETNQALKQMLTTKNDVVSSLRHRLEQSNQSLEEFRKQLSD